MLDIGDKKLCDLCFEEVINDACVSCDGISNIARYITALKEGTVLAGKYAVGRVLGKGGFGVTYLCFNLENGKKVAIKEYFPDSLVTRNTVDSEVKIVSEDKKEAFALLDGLERLFREYLVSDSTGAFRKERVIENLKYVEEARRDLLANVNYKYAIRNLILNIGG